MPYYKRFDFADLSRNPDNKEEDFSNFINDKDMAEVVKRLKKDTLPPQELDFVTGIEGYEFLLGYKQLKHEASLARKDKKIEKLELKVAEIEQRTQNLIEQEKQKVEQEKQKVEQARLKEEQEHEKVERSVLVMLNQGVKAEIIAKILDIPIEQIIAIENKYKDNNPILEYLKN